MQSKHLLIALAVSALLPAAALAQPLDPGCERANHDDRVAGTVMGAIGGAVIGSAVAGNHNRGAGAVVGGVGGAMAGNAIAGARARPCPEGYVYREPVRRHDGYWDGGPEGIGERIDITQDRLNRTAREGGLSRREADRLYAELADIRRDFRRMSYQDGGRLSYRDRDYLQQRLDDVNERMHWMRRDR